MAIMHKPALLIVDEPTSAMDIITQAQILKLFRSLNTQHGMAIVYISHHLLSGAALCDRLCVIQDGAIVESGPTEELFRTPRHPYVRALVSAPPVVPTRVCPCEGVENTASVHT